MNAVECIKTRRSIRKFEDKPVDRELIASLVETASYAPTWKNTQTTRYIAVTDPDLKKKIAEECVLGFAGNTNSIIGAPVLIVTTIVHGRSGFERDGSYSTSKEDRWEVYDAGICAQTFCLAAHDAGLGTVIMGIFDETKVAEALDIPEGQIPSALIALGYPAVSPEAPRRKPVEDLLSFR